MVFFEMVPTVWYFLEWCQQCGILWNSANSVVFFGMMPTVWYFLEWCQQCGIFWNGANSVVFFSPFYHKVIYISNKMANHRSDRATSVQYSPVSGSVPRGTTGIPDSCPTYQRSYLWVCPLCLGRLQVSLTAALLTNVVISGSVLCASGDYRYH